MNWNLTVIELVNLHANAARYTDTGGRLAVWVHASDGEAIVRVRDSGISFASEALRHIFDLFKPGDAADPRSNAGLGVGLALVRNRRAASRPRNRCELRTRVQLVRR